jgi:hypothetical protein
MDASERDYFQDWDEVAQAVANMPAEGVERFIASLVTQWEIAGRDPSELVELIEIQVKNARGIDEAEKQ